MPSDMSPASGGEELVNEGSGGIAGGSGGLGVGRWERIGRNFVSSSRKEILADEYLDCMSGIKNSKLKKDGLGIDNKRDNKRDNMGYNS